MAMTERECLNMWRRAVTESVRSDAPDMTSRQQAILMSVALMPGPHTVRGLAERLNIAKPAVTRAIDTLERLAFVKRIQDESDLRSIFIERTPKGMAHLREFGAMIVAASAGEIESSAQAQDVQAA